MNRRSFFGVLAAGAMAAARVWAPSVAAAAARDGDQRYAPDVKVTGLVKVTSLDDAELYAELTKWSQGPLMELWHRGATMTSKGFKLL